MSVNMRARQAFAQERIADDRQIHLSAVSMAAQGQRHALGHARKDKRLMGEQNCGRIVGHACQRTVEIVATDKAPPRNAMRHLVGESHHPERDAVLYQPHGLIVEHAHRGMAQGAGDSLAVVAGHVGQRAMPDIVIAEHAEHAMGRSQGAERRAPFVGMDSLRHNVRAAVIIAQQHDHVGIERVDSFANALDAGGGHPRIAGVGVGEDGYFQIKPRRPFGRREGIAGDLKQKPGSSTKVQPPRPSAPSDRVPAPRIKPRLVRLIIEYALVL